MIKYYVLPEQRKVVAVLKGTKYDCVFKIQRALVNSTLACWDYDKYLMPNCFKAVAKCDPADTFDEEVGKNIAKTKLMERYYRHLDHKWDKFLTEMIEINQKVFKNIEENC